MKAHDILGIDTSASIDEIEESYQRERQQLLSITPLNNDEKVAVDRKLSQLEIARSSCIDYTSKPLLQRVITDTCSEVKDTNKLRSCSCIPPGLGWCCAQLSDGFFATCCCNDHAESYETCGDPPYPGMDPSINWFRVIDALGWICCVAIAIPFAKEIFSGIGDKRRQRRQAAEERRRAAEAEIRRRQEEEEKKKREEERIRKLKEKAEVEDILTKTYTYFNQIIERKNKVLVSMELLNEVSPSTELSNVILAYKRRIDEDALAVKRIVDELRTKPGFKEGCTSFAVTYSKMFDYVDKL